MSAPTTPDLVTLRLPRDVAREYLRALESLMSEADDAADDLTAEGWNLGDQDYCPDHADAHRGNEVTP